MDEAWIGRHLLASDGTINEFLPAYWFTSSPLVIIVCSIISMAILVVVIAMCTCTEKDPSEAGEPTLKQVTPNPDRKTQLRNGLESSSVKVEIENGNRTSNGIIVNGKDTIERPKSSHDQRALPEIPALSTTSVSQTEDEEEDEGHYDVIIRSRQRRISGQKVANQVSPTGIQNVYENVDNDPMYAGVAEAPNSPYNRHPYAVVDGIGNADYAHIDEESDKGTPNRDITRVKTGIGCAPQASIETLDDSMTTYSSVSAAPPVPDKHFESEEALAAASVTPLSNNSPFLPPRNGAAAGGLAESLVTIGDEDSTIITSSQNGASIVMVTQDGDTAPPPKKKEPPYSSVTARESLANIRERQAHEMMVNNAVASTSNGSGASGPTDVMYEAVNYDQIKSMNDGSPASEPDPADTHSLASDLYAEIGSDSGANSTRSSLYARIRDVRQTNHAPTPPPVEVLRCLASGGDEASHAVRQSRPHTTYYADSAAAGGGDVVYAVIDKTRKGRASVHISSDIERGISMPPASQDQLYAQVHKPQTNSANFVGTGARPKVREAGSPTGVDAHAAGPSMQVAKKPSSEPGYQTIGSIGREDSSYDNIVKSKSSDISEYDPNYESVQSVRASMPPGVATEINPDANPHGMVHITSHKVDSEFWHKREHVYQEITEAQQEKMRLENSRYSDRTSTAL